MHKKGKSSINTCEKQPHQLSPIKIQRIFIINTPKIIKFTYTANSNQTNNVSFCTPSKESYEQTSKQSSRKTKIKLVSRKNKQIDQLNKSSFKLDCKTQKKDKVMRKLKTYCSTQSKKNMDRQNIEVQSFLNCSILQKCMEVDQYDKLQQQNPIIKKTQSRTIIKHQDIYPQKQKTEATKVFGQRKRIFNHSNLNQSYTYQSIHTHSRSRSRKSIFQHYDLKNRSRSLSQNLSFSRKYKIFEPLRSKLLRRQIDNTVKEEEIPELILCNWKQKERSTSESINYNKSQLYLQ